VSSAEACAGIHAEIGFRCLQTVWFNEFAHHRFAVLSGKPSGQTRPLTNFFNVATQKRAYPNSANSRLRLRRLPEQGVWLSMASHQYVGMLMMMISTRIV
jgi:hypothetical protein